MAEIENKNAIFSEEALDAAESAEKQAEAAEQAEEVTSIDVLSADEFFALFRSGFAAGSAFTGLKSLEIQDDERGARILSDKIYRIISETPVLRRLIENGGLMALDWFIILSWAGKKTLAVVAERSGTDPAGAVQKIAERAGSGFVSGVVSKVCFLKKKE